MPTQAQAHQIIGELLSGHGISGGDNTRVPPTFQVLGALAWPVVANQGDFR
jgi:hypothetical protein